VHARNAYVGLVTIIKMVKSNSPYKRVGFRYTIVSLDNSTIGDATRRENDARIDGV